MTRRNVAVPRHFRQTVQRSSRILLSSGGGVRCTQKCNKELPAARELETLFCRLNGFGTISCVSYSPCVRAKTVRKIGRRLKHTLICLNRVVEPAHLVVTPA